jgi:rubrerythrin
VLSGEQEAGPIPERRPPPDERARAKAQAHAVASGTLSYPVWRCRVCGYLCARDEPPGVCPICKAKKDRFERFM